jgi:protein-disulfide isomerase
MTDRARRSLLWLGGAAVVYAALSEGPAVLRRVFPPEFEFEPVSGLPGFRRIPSGSVSAGPVALIGLEPGASRPEVVPPDALRATLCSALFGEAGVGATVPVAYFTDIRCQWCRLLTPLLLERAEGAEAPIRIAWHELPLLGESSHIAARAAIAAAAQGAGTAWHRRVTGAAVVPSPAYLGRIAEEIGLDPDRLVADMDSPATERRLALSRGLADLFGFIGTPALVVGRTAVLGRIDAPDLDGLIALERAAGPLPCA